MIRKNQTYWLPRQYPLFLFKILKFGHERNSRRMRNDMQKWRKLIEWYPLKQDNGTWRSLVAHSAGGRVVGGSNPLVPTIFEICPPLILHNEMEKCTLPHQLMTSYDILAISEKDVTSLKKKLKGFLTPLLLLFFTNSPQQTNHWNSSMTWDNSLLDWETYWKGCG